MPDADSTKAGPMGAQSTDEKSAIQDTRTLAESFNLFMQYGDEFMDENPLVGEPGSFIMSRTGDGASSKQPGGGNRRGNNIGPGQVGTPQVRMDTPGRASDKGAVTPGPEKSELRRKKGKAGV